MVDTNQAVQQQLQQLEQQRQQAIQDRNAARKRADDLRRSEKFLQGVQGTKDEASAASKGANEANTRAEALREVIDTVKKSGETIAEGSVKRFVIMRERGFNQRLTAERRASKTAPKVQAAKQEFRETIQAQRQAGKRVKVLTKGREVSLVQQTQTQRSTAARPTRSEEEAGMSFAAGQSVARPSDLKTQDTRTQRGVIFLKKSEIDARQNFTPAKQRSLSPEEKSAQESINFAERSIGVTSSGAASVSADRARTLTTRERFQRESRKEIPILKSVSNIAREAGRSRTALSISPVSATKRGRQLSELQREVTGGIAGGLIPTTRGEVATTGITFGAGALVGGGTRAFLTGTRAFRRATRIGGTALGVGAAGLTGIEIAAAESPQEFGEIVGRTGRDVLVFGLGAKLGGRPFQKRITKRAAELEAAEFRSLDLDSPQAKQFIGKDLTQFESGVIRSTKAGAQEIILTRGESQFGKASNIKLPGGTSAQTIPSITRPSPVVRGRQIPIGKGQFITDIETGIFKASGLRVGGEKISLDIQQSIFRPIARVRQIGTMSGKRIPISETVSQDSLSLVREVARVRKGQIEERFFTSETFTPRGISIETGRRPSINVMADIRLGDIKATKLLGTESIKSTKGGTIISTGKKTPFSKTFGKQITQQSSKDIQNILSDTSISTISKSNLGTPTISSPPLTLILPTVSRVQTQSPKILNRQFNKEISRLTSTTSLKSKQKQKSTQKQFDTQIKSLGLTQSLKQPQAIRSLERVASLEKVSQIQRTKPIQKLVPRSFTGAFSISTPGLTFPELRLPPPKVPGLPKLKKAKKKKKKKRSKGFLDETEFFVRDFTSRATGIRPQRSRSLNAIERALGIRA